MCGLLPVVSGQLGEFHVRPGVDVCGRADGAPLPHICDFFDSCGRTAIMVSPAAGQARVKSFDDLPRTCPHPPQAASAVNRTACG